MDVVGRDVVGRDVVGQDVVVVLVLAMFQHKKPMTNTVVKIKNSEISSFIY
jgi:hypothetical protein